MRLELAFTFIASQNFQRPLMKKVKLPLGLFRFKTEPLSGLLSPDKESMLIERGIEGVEVFGIQLVGQDAQAFAKALEMNDFPGAEEFNGIPNIRVVGKTQNVVIGHPSFLLWYDVVR